MDDDEGEAVRRLAREIEAEVERTRAVSWAQTVVARLDEIDRKLGALIRGLRHLTLEEDEQMADLTALRAAVEAEATVDASVEALISKLVDEIKAAGTDQAALDGLTAQLTAEAAALSTAVTTGTAAVAPAPAPAPEPAPAPAPTELAPAPVDTPVAQAPIAEAPAPPA